MGNRFIRGEKTALETEPHDVDMRGIAAAVSHARSVADYVIVSIHGHESAGPDKSIPAEFLKIFARSMIDAGADMIAGHGPHVLRGIELYKGRPIFYSLGNFILPSASGSLGHTPSAIYEIFGLDARRDGGSKLAKKWRDLATDGKKLAKLLNGTAENRSIIVTLKWDDKRLVGIDLHPIIIGDDNLPLTKGRPMLANKIVGKDIIESLELLSKPFGTSIIYDKSMGIGRIKLP